MSKNNYYFIRAGFETPPFPTSIVLRYTAEEIDQLEREGQARRRKPHGMPDPSSLSQILRVVGAYVGQRGGHLLWVSKRGQWVTIQYDTEDGQRKEETHPDSSMRDLCVNMYLQRERLRRVTRE